MLFHSFRQYCYTISINFLHMFCRVPDVSVPSSTRSANSLNIHAACEDSCCLILQIHGYSHSCIFNCITILCSFILPYPGELLPDVTYTSLSDQLLPSTASYSYQYQQLPPNLQMLSALYDISGNAPLNR